MLGNYTPANQFDRSAQKNARFDEKKGDPPKSKGIECALTRSLIRRQTRVGMELSENKHRSNNNSTRENENEKHSSHMNAARIYRFGSRL